MHKPTYSPYFERGQRRASLEIDHFENFEGFEGFEDSDCEIAADNDAASQWPPPGDGDNCNQLAINHPFNQSVTHNILVYFFHQGRCPSLLPIA